jgi:plasmid stabilization system protein ParE
VISPRERRLVVDPTAAREVEEAAAWYDDQTAGLGLEFLRAITAVFAAVRRAPLTYQRVQADTRRALVRRFPYGVFFRETETTIVVLAVVHTHRDPQVWQSRG